MFSSVNKNVEDSYHCQNFYEIAEKSTTQLPEDLILEIFALLNFDALIAVGSVNRQWRQIANQPILWKKAIYSEIAFGNDKWAKLFGTEVVKDEDNNEELSSLPLDEFIADCKNFKSLFPEKNPKDLLMLVRLPKTLNGGLTLKSLTDLAEKFFSNCNDGYKYIWKGIVQELRNDSIDKSHWVMMTKSILPGSKDNSYCQQEKMIAALAEKSLIGYEVPGVLESTACILSQYFDPNIRLFNDDSSVYTRCKEGFDGHQIIVGGLAPVYLRILRNCCNAGHEHVGIAALRRF